MTKHGGNTEFSDKITWKQIDVHLKSTVLYLRNTAFIDNANKDIMYKVNALIENERGQDLIL